MRRTIRIRDSLIDSSSTNIFAITLGLTHRRWVYSHLPSPSPAKCKIEQRNSPGETIAAAPRKRMHKASTDLQDQKPVPCPCKPVRMSDYAERGPPRYYSQFLNGRVAMNSEIKFSLALAVLVATSSFAGETNDSAQRLRSIEENLAHLDARLSRQINELYWTQRLSKLASIDKIQFTGPPPHSTNSATVPAGSNDVIVSALTFVPREASVRRKLPLIVLAHGEIHGNLANEEEWHVVQELLQQ